MASEEIASSALWSPRNPHRIVRLSGRKRSKSSLTEERQPKRPLKPLGNSQENSSRTVSNPFVCHSPKKLVSPTSGFSLPDSESASTFVRHRPCDREYLSRLPTETMPSNETQRVQPMAVSTDKAPFDWSLKNRVRFTSSKMFDWAQLFKSVEESAGLMQHVRGENRIDGGAFSAEGVWRTSLQKALMYWAHPNLPWLKLFPRTHTEHRLASSATGTSNLQPLVHEALLSNWTDSFQSLFSIWDNNQCSYFYICAAHTTFLFRSVLGKRACLIAPTTKGFRDRLRAEDVDFSMPLLNDGTSAEDSTSDDTLNHSGEICNDENTLPVEMTEEANPSEWLVSMGLKTEQFPSLQHHHLILQEARSHQHDQRPQSLVVVDENNTRALFNFLICNSKQLVAAVGPQAGLPPTILAPEAFCGATLCSVKARPSILHRAKGGKTPALEITGPVLPSQLQQLCSLLKVTQDGSFRLNCDVHEPTAVFNDVPCGNKDTQPVTLRVVAHDNGLYSFPQSLP